MSKEILFKNHENGMKVAKALLDEEYVVMLSYEGEWLIVTYVWSEHNASRSDVVFMPLYEFDDLKDTLIDNAIADLRHDIKKGFIKDLSDI